jgi:hypothetical protein
VVAVTGMSAVTGVTLVPGVVLVVLGVVELGLVSPVLLEVVGVVGGVHVVVRLGHRRRVLPGVVGRGVFR